MKKFLCLLMAAVICICLAGCTDGAKKKDSTKKQEENAENKCPEFLYSHDWMHYNESCTESISFRENAEFFYSCSCGSPVDYYDLYDSYTYIEEEKTVRISGPDMEDEDIKVIYYDESYLVLCFKEKGVQVFLDEEFAYNDYAPHADMEQYGAEGWVYLTVLGYNNETIQIAPFDYDKDAYDSFEPYITTFEHEDEIPFKFVGSVTENGETITKHYDIDADKTEYIGEYYTNAYIHFNNEGKIDEGVFYGALEIQDVELNEEDEREIY